MTTSNVKSYSDLLAKYECLLAVSQHKEAEFESLLAVSQHSEQEIAELKTKLEWYSQQFLLLKHKHFGHSSEQSTGQEVFVFNEAEELADPKLPEISIDVPAHKRKARGHRQEAIEGLEVEEVHYDLEGDDLKCTTCQSEMHKVNEERRDELEITPPKFKIKQHLRSTYCCRNCHDQGKPVLFKTAPMPTPAFPGSLASPSAVSFIINQKFVMGTPLYRIEQNFKTMGRKLLSRQTMANWMIRGAQNLHPIHARMKETLTKMDILHADETTMQVLHEPGRKAQSKSYMWLYMSGRSGPPIILYDYQETRAALHPKRFLSDFKGYLHVDGYIGYDNLPGITPAACWAHARRKFIEAIQCLLEPEKTNGGTAAHRGLEFCNALFAVEQKIQNRITKRIAGDLTTDWEIVQEERNKYTQPILDVFLLWLEEQKQISLPTFPLGKAVNYIINQWNKLNVFMLDPRLEIDNNRAERAIKPFVIGRKNWLFANTPKGAASSAVLYSIVETAKQNELDPFKYIEYLFTTLPAINLEDTEVIDNLMPWSAPMQEQFNPFRNTKTRLPEA